MRKKTVKCIADEIFWLVLSFLPVIGYLIYLLAYGQNAGAVTESGLGATVLSFGSFMSYSGFHMVGSNLFYPVFTNILGPTGVMPLLNDVLVRFFSYFCCIQVMHLLVDVLLFVVRLAHKWMNKATQGD